MGGETKLSGPDLKLGILASELSEGGMLLGHADGEAILLARRGGKVFAVGATCTHYGGPLGEGILVGDTVRCPWHHACFSLRTGSAVEAPALSAVACWDIEQTGDKLHVLRKRDAPATPGGNAPLGAAGRVEPGAPERIVIVGAGAAGAAAAEMLRREGFAGRVVLVGRDPDVPVDRPNLSKDYLAGTAPEEWIPLRPASFYAEHQIELLRGVGVQRIDVASRTLALDNGEPLSWDRLLLATGADPIALPIAGAELPHVFYLRSFTDCRRIIEAATGASRAVVIGASFIGLEVAGALRTRGIGVDVVAPEARPLERVMGPALGDFIRALHEDKGVVFHLGDSAASIGSKQVSLESGATLAADLVVVGVGVRPALGLAEAAGLAVDRGISVDEKLATSVPGIFAAGDVARYPDRRTGQKLRIEHWVVAQRQGQVAARNMLGHAVPFASVPFFWSQHYDLPIAYVGYAESWDRMDVVGSIPDRDCAVAFRRGGVTLAVASIYRDELSLRAEAAMEQNDEATLQRLVPASD
jgi:NADPH-dependent 2,4-dienoyl-CoA reductase/sulfur reductase-like enzyme/nitrite reductase/ring-hydroxylating ferredoxin subunit